MYSRFFSLFQMCSARHLSPTLENNNNTYAKRQITHTRGGVNTNKNVEVL